MRSKIKQYKKLIESKIFIYRFLPIIVFILFSAILLFIYYRRVGSFSFIDEFNNFVAGYFMLKGKTIYGEFFFNHQMLMPYISYGIQKIFQPTTLYLLVLYHRLFIIFYSFLMGLILVFRFGWTSVGFLFVYELTKFYLFGHLFLAEAIITYPLIYVFGVLLEKIKGLPIYKMDIFFTAIFLWFVIFSREPFIPLAILLLSVTAIVSKRTKFFFFCIFLFGALSIMTLLSIPLSDYIHQVFYINSKTVGAYEMQANGLNGIGIVKILFYPLTILLLGNITYLRIVLICLTVLFFTVLFFQLKINIFAKKRLLLFSYIVLLFAGIRYVVPGTEFYAGYRLLPWYGIFLFYIVVSSFDIFRYIKIGYSKKIILALFVLLTFIIFYPASFIWEKIDRHKEFVNNYNLYYSNGEIIKKMADEDDTFFVEGWESLLYWQADIKPAYKDVTHYPIIAQEKEYTERREEMFAHYPPDFFYTPCGRGGDIVASSGLKGKYLRVWEKEKSTCIMVSLKKANEWNKKRKSIIWETEITVR